MQFYVKSELDGLWLVDIGNTPNPVAHNHTSVERAPNFDKTKIQHHIGDRTIKDFLTKEMEAIHIKDVIKNSKVIFSTIKPFCEWTSKTTDSLWHCENSAYCYNSQGKPMCKRHYSFYK